LVRVWMELLVLFLAEPLLASLLAEQPGIHEDW
jgi:hypothetical protein